MPMYEYECAACHKRTEKIQKFSAEPLTVCPHCGEERLERTITAPSFQFAGGGWYKDGYGSAKPAGGGGDTAASTPGGGESAPAAAAPAVAAPAAAAPSAPATASKN